jgi:hypothetical protein
MVQPDVPRARESEIDPQLTAEHASAVADDQAARAARIES